MAKSKRRRVDEDEAEEVSDEEDEDFEGEEEEEEEESPRKRKKQKKSAFIDDAASEDDDEEDEDAGARRRQQRRNRFIDDIAAVDEEEEDEEDEEEVDDLIGDEADEVANQQDLQQVYREMNKRTDEDINPEELEKYIKERFQTPRFAPGDIEQTSIVNQQSLLPTHQDPKLWLVETRSGQEREACMRLMQKAINLARSGTPLAIKSCFVKDHLQGFMYVEAFKEAHVMEAIRGLRNVLVSKGAKLVPLGEMVEAITVNAKAKKHIEVESWVRMRRFPHQGDAAKVVDMDETTQRVLIKFVPRLDYAELSQKQAAAAKEDGAEKKKAQKRPVVRPSARAFSKQEAERHGLQPYPKTNLGTVMVLPGAGEFEDGYELKWVSMRTVVLDEAGPSVEELTRFNQVAIAAKKQSGDDGGAADVPDLLGLLSTEERVVFAKGDKVRVTDGDLAGLWGYVHAVREDGTVEIMPQLKELTELLPFPPAQLEKMFEVGDHVKVTGGQHAGQTGMVVRADNKICTLLSDTTKQELNCFAKDLSESLDVSMGLDTFGKYELHDLVVLDQQTTGVIVAVEKDSCKVLTSESTADNPRIRVCRQPDIKRKFPDNRRITAPDANGNSVGLGDIVTLKEGRLAGKPGTVKYVVRGSLFLQCRDSGLHGGFVCLKSRGVIVKGARAAPTAAGKIDPSRLLRSPAPHRIAEMAGNGGPVLASPMRNAGPGGRGGGAAYGGRSGPGRDRLVGNTVTVAKGPFKGYKGRVVATTDTHVRMELEAQYKTVTVPRTVLSVAEGGVPESVARRAAGFQPPATPGYAPGSRTPMHAWGSRTPMHPSMTPSHPGSATPMHDSAWTAAATPRHPSSGGADDRYRDMSTPYTPADTPGTGVAATPGLEAGTPSFGYMPAETPALDQRTPGTVDAYSPAPFNPTAATPPVGLTPALDDGGLQNRMSRARLFESVLVSLPSRGGQAAVVRSVDLDGRLLVQLGALGSDGDFTPSHGLTDNVSLEEVRPEPPRKGDRLRVLEGVEAGSEGSLSAISGFDYVVKLADSSLTQQDDDNVLVTRPAGLGRLVHV